MNNIVLPDKNQVINDIISYNKLRLLYWNMALSIAQILYDNEIAIFIDNYLKIRKEALTNKNANKVLITFNNMISEKNIAITDLKEKNIYKIKFLTTGDFYFNLIREDTKFDNHDYQKLIQKFERKILNLKSFGYKFDILNTYYGKDTFNNSEIIIWIQENNLSLKTYF